MMLHGTVKKVGEVIFRVFLVGPLPKLLARVCFNLWIRLYREGREWKISHRE